MRTTDVSLPGADPRPRGRADPIRCDVIAGPDRRPPYWVETDRIVVGRDPAADVVVADPRVAAHHVLVTRGHGSGEEGEGDDDGRDAEATWTVTPLVGARRVAVDGCCVNGAVTSSGASIRLDVGNSAILLGDVSTDPGPAIPTPGPRIAEVEDASGEWVVHRRLAPTSSVPVSGVRAPTRPVEAPSPPTTALIGAIVAVIGAVVVASVMGSAMFAVFALVAAAGSTVMWAGSWVGVIRRRRRDEADWAASVSAFEQELSACRRFEVQRRRREHPGVGAALAAAEALCVSLSSVGGEPTGPGLWSIPHRPAVFDVVVGTGAVSWIPPMVSARNDEHGVVVGTGAVSWIPPMVSARNDEHGVAADPELEMLLARHRRLSEVPITIDVAAGSIMSIVGVDRAAVVRSVIAQLAWRYGPSEWSLVVLTDQPTPWRWVEELPHCADGEVVVDLADGRRADIAVARLLEVHRTIVDAPSTGGFGDGAIPGGGGGTGGPLPIIIVDRADGSNTVDPAIRRALADPSVASIVMADEAPSWVDDAVVVHPNGSLARLGRERSDLISAVAVGVSIATAARVASALGPLRDPEADAGRRTPRHLSFEALHRDHLEEPVDVFDGAEIAGRWEVGGRDPRPVAAIGCGVGGVMAMDLSVDGPHALIAGTTGSGKSEMLRTLIAALAVGSSPNVLSFVLVDYKGGAAFDACAELPHVVGLVTDLDEGLAARALSSLDAELRRRSQRFREMGASDLSEYRALATTDEPLPRLVVVIDEFATLAKELPEFLTALVDVAQRGRSLGVHLILATQRPAGVVNDDIRANTALRVALRTQEPAESIDVIGVPDAARLDRSVPGRALRAMGGGRLAEFQVAGCTAPTDGAASSTGEDGDAPPTELMLVVAALRAAWTQMGSPALRTPWLPPLPDRIEHGALAAELAVGGTVIEVGDVEAGSLAAASSVKNEGGDAKSTTVPRIVPSTMHPIVPPIGVLDDPAAQRRLPLRWEPGDGLLMLTGAVGAGTTSALLAIGAAACSATGPDALHLFVIDARGDRRLDVFESVGHCGGVIGVHQYERLRRLFDRLLDESVSPTRTLLLIDGLDALRLQLQSVGAEGDPELALALRTLLSAGADRRLDVVATERTDSLPPGITPRHRWVGAVDDPMIARSVGWRSAPVSPSTPGRFGVLPGGLVGHLALGAPGLADLPARGADGGPEQIVELAPVITMEALGVAGREASAADGRLCVGLDAASLRPTGPVIDPATPTLLVGRPAAGVSSALATIAAEWARRHPDGEVIWIRRQSELDAIAATSIDAATGADLVPDPGGGSDAETSVGPTLLLIDDAHRIDDPSGWLTRSIEHGLRTSRVSLVAGTRLEPFRSAYGHWTRTLAATERGLAFAASGTPPLEVFGASAPRRPVVAARPGLGWMVEGGAVSAVQFAVVDPTC